MIVLQQSGWCGMTPIRSPTTTRVQTGPHNGALPPAELEPSGDIDDEREADPEGKASGNPNSDAGGNFALRLAL